MLPPAFYTSENVKRAKYAQVATAILAGSVCAYLVFTTISGVRDVWNSEFALRRERQATVKLAKDAAKLRRDKCVQAAPSNGGLEHFAVAFSRWASARELEIDSIAPEGAPSLTPITFGNAKLGDWAVSKVRVKGSGPFTQFQSLLNGLSRPGMPVQLESMQIQSTDQSGNGSVSFDLLVTVYERKRTAS